MIIEMKIDIFYKTFIKTKKNDKYTKTLIDIRNVNNNNNTIILINELTK